MDTEPTYLGDHNWQATDGYIIVCFEIYRIVWAGKPSLSGWDNPLRRELIEQYANAHDADERENTLRNQREPNISYITLPLQVKKTSTA